MLRAASVLRSGEFEDARVVDRVALDADDRNRRRVVLTGEGGTTFLLDLPQAGTLRDGDGLVLDDGAIVRVVGLAEPLAEMTAATPLDFVRLAWHLGNRHAEVAFAPGALRVRRDHVLEAMAEGLGATVTPLEAAFDPEPAAAHEHDADHAHHHTSPLPSSARTAESDARPPAAALYRRAMIEDISLDGEFFDSDFFVYREDADVAWRAQLMGWKCLYAPYARGYHVRKVLPGNRRALPPEINMHSVKNRFLMRIKNISPNLYFRNWFSITARDLLVVMCCLLWEHTSLKAFWLLVKNMRRVMAKRRVVQAHRKVDDEYMASWFQYKPVSKQAPRKMVRMLSRSEAART